MTYFGACAVFQINMNVPYGEHSWLTVYNTLLLRMITFFFCQNKFKNNYAFVVAPVISNSALDVGDFELMAYCEKLVLKDNQV